MKLQASARGRTLLALLALALITIGQFMWAQNLGSAPASNVAVQGQTGAQPEGAFLNFINWVGNVIAPVGAGGAVLGAVVSWLTGRASVAGYSRPQLCWQSQVSRDSSSSGSRTEQVG